MHLLVPLLLAALLLGGCSGLSGTDDLEYVGGDGAITQVPPDEREAPVEVSGEALDGGQVDLADFRGGVTVVNVWWSGCGPCLSEMPLLVSASDELDDVEFVGINIRDNSADVARAFERRTGVDYPSIYDPGSETLLRFGRKYIPRSMPTTVVLDREGRVAALINGVIPSQTTLTELVSDVSDEDGG